MRFSYYAGLHCSKCGREFDTGSVQTYCAECRAPLLAEYDLEAAKQAMRQLDISHRQKGMWRWHEFLPVDDAENVVSLGEGDTPLLPAIRLGRELGLSNIYIKEEGLNPTGSFKARGLAAAISKARELGINKVVIPTAGNAGGAMAAYAARAGMHALVIMPADAPRANVEECRIAGAQVEIVEGLISDAAVRAGQKTEQGWFDVSTFKEPFRVEGKKIMGYEIAEALGWNVPDVILYPTGGGTGLVGMWKAFDELEKLGWLRHGKRPRMVSIQAEGCAPIVRAFKNGMETSEFWDRAYTIATGLRVPKSFADRLILNTLRESQGLAVSVSDPEIQEAQKLLGKLEGLFAAPEGAATVAGLVKLARDGWVEKDERIVIFNTATGLKYL